MREFTVRKGNFAGQHIVYDTVEEAAKAKIVPISPWWNPDVRVGDWVIADDGYIVQCLTRFKLPNKRARSGQFTDCFRFPMGTFYVYHGVKSDTIKNFYAHVTNHNKSSLGNTSKLGQYMTIKKREFVTLLSIGFDPYSAYVKAFKVSMQTPAHMSMQINKLLSDKLVKEALMEALKPYMQSVQDKIKEITGYKDLHQLFVEKMAEILTQEYKDPRVTIMSFKLGMEMFGLQLGLIAPTKASNNKEVTEAEFTIMKPPQLGNQ